ncbi:MAG: hypothetical protein WBP81_02225 [Solirubrobacteraceae bacterium]
MTSAEHHQRAVARSLSFAQEAAGRSDFDDALAWLRVVATVDGGLPAQWERARACWLRRERWAQEGGEPATAPRDAGRAEDVSVR